MFTALLSKFTRGSSLLMKQSFFVEKSKEETSLQVNKKLNRKIYKHKEERKSNILKKNVLKVTGTQSTFRTNMWPSNQNWSHLGFIRNRSPVVYSRKFVRNLPLSAGCSAGVTQRVIQGKTYFQIQLINCEGVINRPLGKFSRQTLIARTSCHLTYFLFTSCT